MSSPQSANLEVAPHEEDTDEDPGNEEAVPEEAREVAPHEEDTEDDHGNEEAVSEAARKKDMIIEYADELFVEF